MYNYGSILDFSLLRLPLLSYDPRTPSHRVCWKVVFTMRAVSMSTASHLWTVNQARVVITGCDFITVELLRPGALAAVRMMYTANLSLSSLLTLAPPLPHPPYVLLHILLVLPSLHVPSLPFCYLPQSTSYVFEFEYLLQFGFSTYRIH